MHHQCIVYEVYSKCLVMMYDVCRPSNIVSSIQHDAWQHTTVYKMRHDNTTVYTMMHDNTLHYTTWCMTTHYGIQHDAIQHTTVYNGMYDNTL